MRFGIPFTALIYLLINNDSGIVNASSLLYDDMTNDRKSTRKNQNNNNNNNNSSDRNFTCNEPFMIPAEYIDNSGNHFAMCLSDPRYHRRRIIWYIQDTNGSDYKALGVAVGKGGGNFVGTVVPIQLPEAGSGMHADPVSVRVHLDRRAGVVTVQPINKGTTGGKLINWIIKPNGFASGSLRVPDSCGPFLTTLKNPALLAPLTGADGKDSTVCILHGSKADAFISWGSFKHDDDHTKIDPLAIDGGIDPKFFSVGFVGSDRGVSIDICDHGDNDAVRCEMSRLVGHARKTFIVGDTSAVIKAKKHKKVKKVKKVKKHKKVKKVKKQQDESSSDEGEFCNIAAPSRKVGNNRPNTDLVKKIDTIEHDLRTILARAEVHSDLSDVEAEDRGERRRKDRREHERENRREDRREVRRESKREDKHEDRHKRRHHLLSRHPKVHHHHRHSDISASDIDNHHHHHPHCPPPIRKHRVKHCAVQHPLLHPRPIAPSVNPAAPAPIAQMTHTNSLARAHESRLMHRMRHMHRRLDYIDVQITRAESILARRFASFARWLRRQKLKMTDTAREFVNHLEELKRSVVYAPKSKTEHKLIKDVGKVFRKGTKSIGSVVKAPVAVIDTNLIDPIKENVVDPVVSETSIKSNLNDSKTNVVGKTLNSATNFVSGTTFKSVNRNDRFDFNDDLLPPSGTQLARAPSPLTNPLGPVGPVLPPPAVKTFKNSKKEINEEDQDQDQSLRDAIEYLN